MIKLSEETKVWLTGFVFSLIFWALLFLAAILQGTQYEKDAQNIDSLNYESIESLSNND